MEVFEHTNQLCTYIIILCFQSSLNCLSVCVTWSCDVRTCWTESVSCTWVCVCVCVLNDSLSSFNLSSFFSACKNNKLKPHRPALCPSQTSWREKKKQATVMSVKTAGATFSVKPQVNTSVCVLKGFRTGNKPFLFSVFSEGRCGRRCHGEIHRCFFFLITPSKQLIPVITDWKPHIIKQCVSKRCQSR